MAADQPCADPEGCDDKSEDLTSTLTGTMTFKMGQDHQAITLQFYPICWQEV